MGPSPNVEIGFTVQKHHPTTLSRRTDTPTVRGQLCVQNSLAEAMWWILPCKIPKLGRPTSSQLLVNYVIGF